MRKLDNYDNRFNHNAWDSVEMPNQVYQNAISKITNDKRHINPSKHISATAGAWDTFYGYHQSNFFKDRRWVEREIPLNTFRTVLDLGCGTGSSLASCTFENVVVGYDFSRRAIDICRDKFGGRNASFFVRDITKSESYTHCGIECLLLIFTLSAIPPDLHRQVFGCMKGILAKGGKVFFRDYGYMDMVQLRYKPEQIVAENFYQRPDGTYTYFFTCDYLRNIAEECGLKVVELREDKKLLTNRKRQLSMYRVQIVGVFELE
ncbi:tRNA(Thr) (cytosine(32)-N(3))-methyltransferase [Dictyocoela roeselum]|nr:tRNA(Thr) (cytosine(32)-N(3))-methyltransferase [Dictyocoela roeselum]